MKKKTHKRKHGNTSVPYVDRIAMNKTTKNALGILEKKEVQARIRLGWAYIIAMGETEGFELTPEQISAVAYNANQNMNEWEEICKRDGDEVADSKLYRRVMQILGGVDDVDDYNYESILDPDVIQRNNGSTERIVADNEHKETTISQESVPS